MVRSLWFTVWSKAWSVDIRTKIIGIVALCIISSALAMVWFTYHEDSAIMREELQGRGIAIGASLAAQSRDLILTHNEFALYTLVDNTHNSYKDLVYAFVLDSDGDVLVHTFDEGFPLDLLTVNSLPSDQEYGIMTLQTEDGRIQDIAVPVLGGKAGLIRLGLSEVSIRAALSEHIGNILIWVGLILAFGLSIAYALASVLTVPVSRLVEAAQAIGRGDFQWKTPVWAKDEIGSLGAAFNEMSEELKRKEEMRGQLLAKVIGAQEEERKRIARELHDETSQALTSMIVGLKYLEESAGSPKVQEKSSELRALAAHTLDEVHHLAMDLRPILLDDLGLVAAIQRYAKQYSENMNINVDTYFSGVTDIRLPSEIEIAAYRIIQEALTNIAKYAEAKNVSVVLSHRDSSLVAIVEDDGIGFDVNSVMNSQEKKGLGIFGMYERASLIGGKLTIESESGAGTTVYLEVPFMSTGSK